MLGDAFNMRWWVTAPAAAVCIAGGILFRKKSGIAATYTAFAVLFVAMTTTTLRTTPLDLPYNQPMPWELLREMVEFCVQERFQ